VLSLPVRLPADAAFRLRHCTLRRVFPAAAAEARAKCEAFVMWIT